MAFNIFDALTREPVYYGGNFALTVEGVRAAVAKALKMAGSNGGSTPAGTADNLVCSREVSTYLAAAKTGDDTWKATLGAADTTRCAIATFDGIAVISDQQFARRHSALHTNRVVVSVAINNGHRFYAFDLALPGNYHDVVSDYS